MNVEQRAHDLTISFLISKFNSEDSKSSDSDKEEAFFKAYKVSYDRFLEMLTEGF